MILKWIIKLVKKVIDYLILNETLIKAYLSNYKNETLGSLTEKLAVGFAKQEAGTILINYTEQYIQSRLDNNRFIQKAKVLWFKFADGITNKLSCGRQLSA